MGWCERCEVEREGVICPVCGETLLQEITPEELEQPHPEWGRETGRLLDQWPDGPDGTPEKAEMLTLAADFEQCRRTILAQIEAAGIPAFYRYPDGDAETAGLGFYGYGVFLFVPESRLEEAEDLVGGLIAPRRIQ